MAKKQKNYYLDNEKFGTAIVEYKALCAAAEKAGKELPRMSNYLAESFWALATGIIRKPNFANYAYADDMVADGVERCFRYARSYNPEKTTNAFGYFSQIITMAFIQRIQWEQRETYHKYKLMLDQSHLGLLYEGDMSNAYSKTNLEYAEAYVENYEKLEAARKKKYLERKAAKAEKEASE